MPTDMNIQFRNFDPLVCHKSNAINIGTYGGDTAVVIAAATRGGVTYAYEPHPKTYYNQQKTRRKIYFKWLTITLL